jgi:hypothetical protein
MPVRFRFFRLSNSGIQLSPLSVKHMKYWGYFRSMTLL